MVEHLEVEACNPSDKVFQKSLPNTVTTIFFSFSNYYYYFL